MAQIVVDRVREDPDLVFVRRWTFEIVIRGNPFAVLRLFAYEEGTKPSRRHRNVKVSKRVAYGTRSHGFGAEQDRKTRWWDATRAHQWSAVIGDLRGSGGPADPPDLPADVRAEALAAFEVRVEVPDAV